MLRFGRERSFDIVESAARFPRSGDVLLALAPSPLVQLAEIGGWPRWLRPSHGPSDRRSALPYSPAPPRRRGE